MELTNLMNISAYLKLYNKIFKRKENNKSMDNERKNDNSANEICKLKHYKYIFSNMELKKDTFDGEIVLNIDNDTQLKQKLGVFKIILLDNLKEIHVYTLNDSEDIYKELSTFIEYIILNLYKDTFYSLKCYDDIDNAVFPQLKSIDILNDENKIQKLELHPIKFYGSANLDIVLIRNIPNDEYIRQKFNYYISQFEYSKLDKYSLLAKIFNQSNVVNIVLDLYDVCMKSWLSVVNGRKAEGVDVYNFIKNYSNKYNITLGLTVPNKSYTTDEISKLRNDIGHLSINHNIVREIDNVKINKMLMIIFEIIKLT